VRYLKPQNPIFVISTEGEIRHQSDLSHSFEMTIYPLDFASKQHVIARNEVTKQSQGEKRDCFAALAMTLSVVGLQNLGIPKLAHMSTRLPSQHFPQFDEMRLNPQESVRVLGECK